MNTSAMTPPITSSARILKCYSDQELKGIRKKDTTYKILLRSREDSSAAVQRKICSCAGLCY